ncbi:hypothetical protein ACIHFD_10775 [Nonomuraea sp. NPDC051941]|uniref:hypothetical protein n=1 Tax=Nonomuraea sp. NPDC051941 TaxID=3364373 RepID=UPI0037C6DF36
MTDRGYSEIRRSRSSTAGRTLGYLVQRTADAIVRITGVVLGEYTVVAPMAEPARRRTYAWSVSELPGTEPRDSRVCPRPLSPHLARTKTA